MAERVFGFRGSLASEAVPDQALQLANAHALGNSMLVLLLAPWGFDFIFYCGALQLPLACSCQNPRVLHFQGVADEPMGAWK